MGLDALLARLEGRAVTSVTPAETPAVTGKSAQLVPCTSVTSVTARNDIKTNEVIRDLPRRCKGYAPGATDTDRRPGRERWPGLIQKGGE